MFYWVYIVAIILACGAIVGFFALDKKNRKKSREKLKKNENLTNFSQNDQKNNEKTNNLDEKTLETKSENVTKNETSTQNKSSQDEVVVDPEGAFETFSLEPKQVDFENSTKNENPFFKRSERPVMFSNQTEDDELDDDENDDENEDETNAQRDYLTLKDSFERMRKLSQQDNNDDEDELDDEEHNEIYQRFRRFQNMRRAQSRFRNNSFDDDDDDTYSSRFGSDALSDKMKKDLLEHRPLDDMNEMSGEVDSTNNESEDNRISQNDKNESASGRRTLNPETIKRLKSFAQNHAEVLNFNDLDQDEDDDDPNEDDDLDELFNDEEFNSFDESDLNNIDDDPDDDPDDKNSQKPNK